MTTRLERQQRRIEKEALRKLDADFTRMAADIGRLVMGAAVGRDEHGLPIVPNSRRVRDALKLRVWTQVIKPYFIGGSESPLVGNQPQSPFMRVVVDGIEAGIQNAAEAQIALLKKYAPDDVFQWLTGRRPFGADVVEMATPKTSPNPSPFPIAMGQGNVIAEQGGHQHGALGYDPFHLFVDANGYTLSDKGWRTALETRRAIDALLDQQIPMGTSAVRIADMLVKYLVPSARGVVTRTPYGTVGSYWARRLARTEITAAAGRSTINMAIANPFVDLVDWVRSLSHPEMDICDTNAEAGPYAPTNVPRYPGHPNCLCTLIARVMANRAEIIEAIRRSIYEGDEAYAPLEGAFNLDWLVMALMSELFGRAVLERLSLADTQ